MPKHGQGPTCDHNQVWTVGWTVGWLGWSWCGFCVDLGYWGSALAPWTGGCVLAPFAVFTFVVLQLGKRYNCAQLFVGFVPLY